MFRAWIECTSREDKEAVLKLLDPSTSSMMKFITAKHHITIEYHYKKIPVCNKKCNIPISH